MPANAGIHVFLCGDGGKTWMPAFAGMTRGGGRLVSVGQDAHRVHARAAD
jgi:hypothetical protein